MKTKLKSFIVGMLVACLAIALPLYIVDSNKYESEVTAAKNRETALIKQYEAKVQHEKTQPSDPLTTTTGDIAKNYAGWQTYTDTNSNFSFPYPPNWVFVEQKDPIGVGYTKVLTPKRFANLAGEKMERGLYGVAISCIGDATTPDTYVAIQDTSVRNISDSFSADMVAQGGRYYVLDRGLQNFVVSKGGTLCLLQKYSTDESKLTKEEDGQAMGMISKFKFL